MARILAVDDDPKIRRFVTRVLAEAGHDVDAVGDAESAFARLLESRPDLFVLDIHLPGMDGLALARKLSSNQGTQSIPVLVISVRTDPRFKVAAFATGVLSYLEKPFKKAALLQAVRLALASRA